MRIDSDGNVGVGTNSPDTSALLDVSSTTKGFLPPRMTTAQRDAISTPATGLMVYNTDDDVMNYYNGSAWAEIGGGGGGSPVGTVITSALASCPSGYLAADGTAINRTTYAALFSAMGTMYGVGDGSTTFNIPDYRGQFLRGWDNAAGADPDAGSRTDRGDGTTGDNVGTKQADEFASHNHGTYFHPNGNQGQWTTNPAYLSGGYPNTAYAGGNETRPVNVNVLYCVKF
jgi:microcystin-dependent protein